MSFPDLAGFAVTFASGDDSWESAGHTGFIRKVGQLLSNHRLQITVVQPPPWLRNAGEVDVAIHVNGQRWNQRFALLKKSYDPDGLHATLSGETTGGDPPYWS